MSAEQIVRDLVERVWNQGNLDELEEFFAPSFDHGGRPDDVAGLRAWHEDDARTWARARYQIMGLVSQEDRVALRWRATAVHVGQWGPVPATGKTISWDGVHFFTVHNGQIVAVWAMADMFGKAQQLGVIFMPPPQEA